MIWRVTLKKWTEPPRWNGEEVYFDFEVKETALGFLVGKIVEQSFEKYMIEYIVKPKT